MKSFVYVASFFLMGLVSCNQAPKNFCTCLEASESLNQKSSAVLAGNTDEKSKSELLEARKVQKEKCKDFEQTTGDNMRKWKKSCEKK